MTEGQAESWVAETFDVPRETMARIAHFVEYLRESNQRQNLVSAPSLEQVWTRHIADSAQLLCLGGRDEASWLDLGTGAGFPGLIVATLRAGPTLLVEERRLRVDFLRGAIDLLGIGARCEVAPQRVERVPRRPFSVISARAFAPLERLLDLAEKFASPDTLWLLPKGRNAQTELEAARPSWQGDFRLEPSLTDPDARIIVAQGVRRREKKRA